MRAGRRFACACLLAALLGCDGDEPPPAVPPARLHHLVVGTADLVGDGDAACTQAPAGGALPGSRWCAFYRRANDGSGTELWVADITRAGPLACDGTSPSCLRLTERLWTGLPLNATAHPFVHRFDGDTLVFYADATSKNALDDPYTGPVRAWRPGWPAARVLTGPNGVYCVGQARSHAAFCLENITTVGAADEIDLMAGALEDAVGGVLPTVAAHVRPRAADGTVAWQLALAPDGAHFAYSVPGNDGRTEVLRVLALADAGRSPPVEILRDVNRWQIAPDSRRIYFLENLAGQSGTLVMADFPGGANRTTIESRVGGITLLGRADGPDLGVGFLQDTVGGRGTFRLMRDRSRPDQLITVEREVRDPLVSPSLRYTYYPHPDGAGRHAGLIAANDGRGVCVLNFKPDFDVFAVMFAPTQRYVFWAEDATSEGLAFEGYYADPEGCAGKRRFSRALAVVKAAGHEIVYGDVEPGGATMVLKHAALGSLGLPDDGGAELGRGVDTTMAVADERWIVFTANRGPADERGLYVYGPVP